MSKARNDFPESYRVDAQLLSDLWIFRVAARLTSITAAADRLCVSQGAVSQRVIRLEGRLGTTLFSRKSGRLGLTEAGQSLLEALNDVAARLDGALSRFDHVQRSSLVVSCMPSIAIEWLVPHLHLFYAENPDVELFVRSEMGSANVERMEDRGIDVLISYQPDEPKGLYELASLREMVIPVCSRSYRSNMEAREGGAALTRLHDVAPDESPPENIAREVEWNRWEEARPEWGKRVEADRYFNLATLAYHAALEGQGVAIGRTVTVNRLISRGELIAATPLPPAPGSFYRILTLRPGDERSAIRKFGNWVRGAMEQTQKETLAMITSAA
jgi:DNA-binding transcriptional LysR family regulator